MKSHTCQYILLTLAGCAVTGGCGGDAQEPSIGSAEHLKVFVDAAMNNEISAEEAQKTYESLNSHEKQMVSELVMQSATASAESGVVDSNFTELQQPNQQASGAVWQQPIENAWTVGYPPGSKFGSSYYIDWKCDDDPSDKEYVFKFGFPASSPNGIRWTSNSSQVYLAFMTAYGGNLLGYGFNFSEARLCIGDNGVALAGGPANVLANVFIHY